VGINNRATSGTFYISAEMLRCGMPRVIQIPLSGGDRKAQAKELRRARGLYDGT